MEQPLYYWDPVIAPSGLAFYTGEAFPGWQGNLLIGSLRTGLLVRLTLEAAVINGLFQVMRGRRDGHPGHLYRRRPPSQERSGQIGDV
jgi:aldose sugar dehydrogenase